MLVAGAALAADGADYDGTSYPDSVGKKLLCDSKTTTGACLGDTGLTPPPGYTNGRAFIEIAKDTGCASCTVEIRVGSGTDERHLLATLTCSGNTAYPHPSGRGFAGQLFGNVTALNGCTDLDVAAHFGKE